MNNNKILDYEIGRVFGDEGRVAIELMNWDEELKVDISTGNGFIIKEHAFRKIKGGAQVKNDYGSHSRLFGSSFEDEDAFAELYSCKCGNLIGSRNEDDVCPHCHSKVRHVGTNMKMTGWMELENEKHFIIHPIIYQMLQKNLPKNAFYEMVVYDMDIDLNGSIISKESDNPFYGIGVAGFKERFFEIMTYYLRHPKLNKTKKENLKEIMNYYGKGLVFLKSIPIFSALLRDTKRVNDEYWYHKIDKKINMMFSQVRLLNGWRLSKKLKRDLAEELALSNLQKYLLQYWGLISEEIISKEGLIKDGIMGGRMNFSARDVIVPDPSLRQNRAKLGYVLFLELYKLELINFISKMRDITPNEAAETWARARTKFDEGMWKLMTFYVKKYKPRILINRNPTINFGSIMLFYIDSIEKGYYDTFVIKLPIIALVKFNADFDGDRLNICSVKIREHEKEFNKYLDPRSSMQISRITGKFDRDMGLLKDQLVGLHIFNTI